MIFVFFVVNVKKPKNTFSLNVTLLGQCGRESFGVMDGLCLVNGMT